MTVLNHTIVHATDPHAAAAFTVEILGLGPSEVVGPFTIVQVSEATTLDFVEVDAPVASQHYAYLVTEAEFDEIFDRIRDRDVTYFADPHDRTPGAINTWDGGRGLYFEDPDGHLLEIITRPYGSGGTTTDRPHPLVAKSRE